MNPVDIAILAVIGVSIIVGLYRGFVSTLVNTGGTLLSMFLSFTIAPKLAALIQGNATLQETLGSYADISSRLGDLGTAVTTVQDLVRQGSEKITEVVARTGLPEPLARLLETNISQQVFGTSEQVQQYVAQTIVNACVNILSYVVCFVCILVVVSLVVRLVEAVFHFPILKQFDKLAGGVFGVLRGALIVFVLLSALPLVQTVLNMDAVNEMINASTLAPWFTGGGMITAIMNGHL